jgi:hypothetical protein
MKVSEIIQLIGAGYTKEEIAALEAQQEPIAAPEGTAPEAPAPDPAPAPVAAPADPAPTQDLLDAIRTLTAAVQHNNKIMTPQPDNIVPDDVQKQADEILTKFLNT